MIGHLKGVRAMPALSFSIRVLLAVIACAAIGCSSISAQAAMCRGADTVKNAANSFIRAAESGSAPAFATALAKHTDVNSLALLALGKYRDRLPPARRDEYVTNARRFMSEFLADHFHVAGLTIESCKGDLIQTSLDRGSDVMWRVSGNRIEDVRVSGFWLALQLRSKFTGIIKREHGDVSALLDYLARVKVAAK
jgi:ABC-type transporter MlaC component